MIRTAHLFAGAGGGILADLILGHTPTIAIEWNKHACKILRERFPGLLVIEADIRDVDFRELAGVDAVCAGFPCTDISAANPNGHGIHGERSGLFREVLRAIDVIRPDWVFLENSPRIRTKGRSTVIRELVARGYTWRDGILSASDCGAPHKRDRWWCLATNTDKDNRPAGDQINGGRIVERSPAACKSGFDLANSDTEGLPEREGRTERSRGEDQQNDGESTLHLPCRNGVPQSGVEGYWDAEPGMGRMAHGVANRTHRIECLGNGQVPICAAAAWRLLGGP